MADMKLCSIINVWADCIELLPFCIANHLKFCDGIIIIWSQHSNHGVKSDAVMEYILANGHDERVNFVQLEPMKGQKPLMNETRKRNHGIEVARSKGYTHFLISDADEFYQASVMDLVKKQIEKEDLNGMVATVVVYISKPTLWCHDHTLVPIIQKMTPTIKVGQWTKYPFAYDIDGKAHIDPSRRPYYSDGVKLSGAICHHFSYLRKDIDLKINNSSAKLHRSRQVIYDELRDAKPGYVSRLYHQPLQECENYFGIKI